MSTRVVSSQSVLDFSMIFASHGISRYTAPIWRLFGFTGFSVLLASLMVVRGDGFEMTYSL